MSFWGGIGDRFEQGYRIGSRMRDRRLQEDEADAYKAYTDADQAIQTAQPGMTEQRAIDVGMYDDRSGIPAGTPVRNSPTQPAMRRDFTMDPNLGLRRQEAENQLLKAVAMRDPSRALMYKQYFTQARRQEQSDLLFQAADAMEAGDERTGAMLALRAQHLEPDGINAQVRRAPDGRLVGVGYDERTGSFAGGALLSADNMRRMAMTIRDPMAAQQWRRQEKMDQMRTEEHGLAMRAGEQQLKQQTELFPMQKEVMAMQLDNAKYMQGFRDQLMSLDIQGKQEAIYAMRMRGLQSLAYMQYLVNGGARGRGTGAGGGVADQKKLLDFYTSLNKYDEDIRASFPQDSAVSLALQQDPATQGTALGFASRLFVDSAGPDGRGVDPKSALRAGYTLAAAEAYASGLKPQDADQSRQLMESLNVTPSDPNAPGLPSVTVEVDGMKYTLDAQLTPGLWEHVHRSAQQGAAQGDQESINILRIMGQVAAANVEAWQSGEHVVQQLPGQIGVALGTAFGGGDPMAGYPSIGDTAGAIGDWYDETVAPGVTQGYEDVFGLPTDEE